MKKGVEFNFFARSICVALLRLRLRGIPLTWLEGGKNGNFNREGYTHHQSGAVLIEWIFVISLLAVVLAGFFSVVKPRLDGYLGRTVVESAMLDRLSIAPPQLAELDPNSDDSSGVVTLNTIDPQLFDDRVFEFFVTLRASVESELRAYRIDPSGLEFCLALKVGGVLQSELVAGQPLPLVRSSQARGARCDDRFVSALSSSPEEFWSRTIDFSLVRSAYADSYAGKVMLFLAAYHPLLCPTNDVLMVGGSGAAALQPPSAPTVSVVETPESTPTDVPTEVPTEIPTLEPTEEPTAEPTEAPTSQPTEEPTPEVTPEPTVSEPTPSPTASPPSPTSSPTEEPSPESTNSPLPTTTSPVPSPSASPEPSVSASPEPTTSPQATPQETSVPEETATQASTVTFAASPSQPPTAQPSRTFTSVPATATARPVATATTIPPTRVPSPVPTSPPSVTNTMAPTLGSARTRVAPVETQAGAIDA